MLLNSLIVDDNEGIGGSLGPGCSSSTATLPFDRETPISLGGGLGGATSSTSESLSEISLSLDTYFLDFLIFLK